MNEQEFQTWLTTATVSALGVKLKENETAALALLANPEQTTPDQLSQATVLDSQNAKIVEQQTALKTAQANAAKLKANITTNQLSNRGGSPLPLAPEGNGKLYARPKSIGKLASFQGDREVVSANGHREVLTAEERALRLGTWMFGAIAGNDITRRNYQSKATEEYGLQYQTMNEGSAGAGGYLVPPEFSSDFIYLSQLYAVARKYMRNIAVSSNDYRQPRKQSSVTVGWEGELATIPNTAMGIDQVQVLLKRLSALVPFSNELNADSIIGLIDWIVKDAVIQMGYKEDLAAFLGDGTLVFGNTVGIIPGLQAIGNNKGVVTQGTGNTWGAITRGDIENLMGALPMFPGMKPRLFCSNAFYRNVLRTLMINAGGTNLIMLAQGGTEFQFDGTEVVISQVLASATGTTQIPLLYGDLEFSSTFVTKGEYTVFQANQGDTMVATNSSIVRIDERVGIINHELGSSSLGGAVVGLQTGS